MTGTAEAPPVPPGRRPRFDPLPEWAGVSTRLVHSGRRPDYNAGAVVPPIYQSATFHWPPDRSESADRAEAYLYTRLRNPTLEVPAEVLCQLEGGEAAHLFASGMGAIASTVLSLVGPGDEVVALEGLYGGTTDLVTDLLPRYGVRVRQVPERAAREPESALPPRARLAIVESPTNPLLHIHDLARWAEAAHRAGALLLVDNTFATPVNQSPLRLGADLVVHSATKYLGGHSDLVAGAVVGPAKLISEIDPKGYLGAAADPFAGFLLLRGLRTLALRMARHNENALAVATAVRHHPEVARVHYPGWAGPEEEEIARRQMRGRSGMLSLSLRGGSSAAERFLDHLRFVHVAASLGGVESLASVPRKTSHRHLSDSELADRGIDEGLVRLSFGIEDTADLVRDVTEALNALS